MQFQKLETYLSEPRLGKYLNACGNSKTNAKKLYSANLRVCQSFYPVLSLFEVFIRNAINNELSNYFRNPDWIINEKDGFMKNQSLQRSRYYLKRCVEKSIRNYSTNPPVDKIISDQTLGFWSALFLPHHYRLLHGSIINAFPYKPPNVNRAVIHKHIKEINSFRNRIYHNEPVCFSGNSISFDKASDAHTLILNLVEWIDPELLVYLSEFDTVLSKISRVESNFLIDS